MDQPKKSKSQEIDEEFEAKRSAIVGRRCPNCGAQIPPCPESNEAVDQPPITA